MNKLSFIIVLFVSMVGAAQTNSNTIAIIPEPVSLRTTSGQFVLPKNVAIAIASQADLKGVSDLLKERLTTAAGRKVTVTNSSSSATISLLLNKTRDAKIGSEGYTLSVTPKNITIRAN